MVAEYSSIFVDNIGRMFGDFFDNDGRMLSVGFVDNGGRMMFVDFG